MAYAQLKTWTPKRAHSFSMRRIDRIRTLLIEIGTCYGDVDQAIVDECDNLNHNGLADLVELLDHALSEGRTA